MAITSDQFKAMPLTKYSDAREQLRTGDILLFHSLGFGSQLTEFFTDSLWSHAAFVWRLADVDRVMLLESMDTVGVRMMPMSTRIDGCAAAPKPYNGGLVVLRHADLPETIAPDKLKAMTQFALDRVGYPYSHDELNQIMLRIALGLAGKIVTGRLDPQNQFICSEYVAKCLETIGIEIAVDKEGYIAPADIANDPKVTGLFSLMPDNPVFKDVQAA